MKKQDWLEDLEDRQRNTVFPDTLQNTGVFYRNLLSTTLRVNPVQRIGIVVVAFLFIGAAIEHLTGVFGFATASDAPWFSVVELFFFMLLMIIGIRLLKRALNARSAPSHQLHLKDKQHPTKF